MSVLSTAFSEPWSIETRDGNITLRFDRNKRTIKVAKYESYAAIERITDLVGQLIERGYGDIQGIELREASRVVWDYFVAHGITKRGTLRCELLESDGQIEFISKIAYELGRYISTQRRSHAKVSNNVRHSIRMATWGDDNLFGEKVPLLLAKLDRRTSYENICRNADDYIITFLDGLGLHVMLLLLKLWAMQGRPDEIIVDEAAFLDELGIDAKGGARARWKTKIRQAFCQWSQRDSCSVVGPVDEAGNINTKLQVFMPRIDEREVTVRGGVKKRVWVIGRLHPALFVRKPELSGGYGEIPLRPLRQLTSRLGNTRTASSAKRAAILIMNETRFGRKRGKPNLSTLGLDVASFGRHGDLRDSACRELIDVLSGVGIEAKVEGERLAFRVTNQDQSLGSVGWPLP